jgi:hypothetical protein
MVMPKKIVGVLASLKVAAKHVLYVELSNSGLIRRMGSGEETSSETDLFSGFTDPEVFRSLTGRLNQKLFRWIGTYADPSPVGRKCTLTIGFKHEDAQQVTSYWEYGTDSIGPPPEIREFVVSLLDLTELWYEEQRRLKDSTFRHGR